MVSDFETKKTLWHRTCRNKADNQKVERALRATKKRESGEEHNESPIKTRKMSGQSLEKTQSCCFSAVVMIPVKLCSVLAHFPLIKLFVNMP